MWYVFRPQVPLQTEIPGALRIPDVRHESENENWQFDPLTGLSAEEFSTLGRDEDALFKRLDALWVKASRRSGNT